MYYPPTLRISLQLAILSILFVILVVTTATSQSSHKIWFVQTGADGDGTSADNPLGSIEGLETASGPGDIIMLMPAEDSLTGGLILKEGQALIGLPEADRKPVITNTDSTKNGGIGIVLAQNNRIWNVRVENTWASGILGANISGTSIEEVEVVGANQSGTYAETMGRISLPHGGIIFLATGKERSGVNRVIRSEVRDARGFGIASFARDGAKSRLSISSSKVEGGTPVARFDWGIVASARGEASEMLFDLADSQVSGRMSKDGRNIVVSAASKANTQARIDGTHLGEVGQDGVLAVASLIPAQVELVIRDCLIEKAGSSNIEGVLLNLPPSDSLRAHKARISIEVASSIVRNVGSGNLSAEQIPENIYIGSGAMAQQLDPSATAPLPYGNFELTVRNCRLEGELGYDVSIGNSGTDFDLGPEQGNFKVKLRENTISGNGDAEFMISAPNASIDAQQNCWGNPEGLLEDRIILKQTAELSQLDASEPLPCDASVLK